ncbi:B3 domain-containing transcription factor VRN1-like isoform X2 [Gastrolobium bilobum]|uniref:B3 domain-containing transcription factor VRN1-like isoform X2 n=1 Tax=Gastrolobium bilobum TaxID=150636 RepID=UPI002AB0CFC5|nr:B3 domain-containing transcription factor VRN1-like isoform X2 [Gastrolobium bilobum]
MSKHPHPTPILFFKIIPGTSLADGKLIPYNFVRKYGGDMSNPMFLKPPDGTEWEVFWTKHDGDIWLQKGWKEFATYYSLDHGHLVLFEYKQTCHFEVHIFDKSTLEIDYPLHVSQDVQYNLDQISDDDSVKILDEIPPCHKTRQKSPMPSPQPCKKSRTGASGDVKRRSTEQNLPQHVQTEGTNFEKSKFSSVKKESDESVQGEGINWLDPQRVVDVENTTVVTRKGEKATHCPFTNGALNEANKFASENPFFTININSGVRPHVPRAFIKECLNNKTQIVKLQFGKKLWPVKLLGYPRNNGILSSGWSQFAGESELLGGELCVLELINREDAVLRVHIFRGHC